MLLFEVAGSTAIIIALIGSGGILGSVVALLKLRPEANTAAIVQAQGAMETMAAVQEALEHELNRKIIQLDHCRKECERLEQEGLQARMMIRHLNLDQDRPYPPFGTEED